MPHTALTSTERSALVLYARGMSREKIALELDRAPSTIGHALTSAKEKLGAKTLTHAVSVFHSQSETQKDRPNG